MKTEEIRKEIEKRKATFRREQAKLPFAEKGRIAFELNKRRNTTKEAKLIKTGGTDSAFKDFFE
ncbi:MAG TPA: hypothetical protein VFC63_07145 [Blastocatellia bacterium]|nr:hypothetical protein [Blastocatellia bacterium]